ncbi:DEAD/DEAH box helicase [Bacillus sp. F19]|nr:DEAD/DEAH box helicase [Bacillus sp. F19]
MYKSRLPHNLFQLQGYQEKYKPLLYKSIRQQFPLSYDESPEIDLRYLLMCASIFSESDDAKHLDTAFRIAQYVLQSVGTSENQKNSAAYILDKMTNHTAINLSINRNQLLSDYKDHIPMEFNLDSMNRLMKYSIFDSKRELIIPINKFQYEVLDETRKNDWVSISAPTSVGKSFILLHIIRMFLQNHSNGVIVYIVPTRALIQQVELDIRKMLIEHQLKNIFVSTVPLMDDLSNRFSKKVFVLTQERFQWLLADHHEMAPELLIVDEAQKIGDGTRGILLQQIIEEVSRRSANGKVIFSSPMTSNPEVLLEQRAETSKGKAVEKELVTVNQNLLWANQVFRKPKEWTMSLCANGEVVKLGDFSLSKRSTNVTERLAFVTHALADPAGGNLVYANLPSSAENCGHILWELQGAENDSNHPEIIELIKLIKDTVNPDYTLAHILSRKVGYHYGNMPLIIKNEIERLFSEGIIQFLICTSTLIEGMNLPARSIFVRGPQKGRGIPMGEMDFWNLAGRAGRQGKEFQGNVICIDTNKEDIWNNSPPTIRKKYQIEKTMDNLLNNDVEKLIEFIDEGTPRSKSLQKPELEYGFSYLLGEYIRSDRLSESPFLQKYDEDSIKELESSISNALKDIEVPEGILLKHPGVSPLAQQQLLDFFKEAYHSIELYTPVHPNNKAALDRYIKIVEKIQEILSGEHPGKNFPYSLLIIEWMRGYSLSRIIARNIKYWQKRDRSKNKQSIIRETMKDIEEFARFKFVKYFACYRDILNYFMELNNDVIEEDLSDLTIWLELGASEKTPISLMGIGFTRTTAISIAEILKDQNLDGEECIKLLKQINWEKVPLSPIVRREVIQILRLYISEVELN